METLAASTELVSKKFPKLPMSRRDISRGLDQMRKLMWGSETIIPDPNMVLSTGMTIGQFCMLYVYQMLMARAKSRAGPLDEAGS